MTEPLASALRTAGQAQRPWFGRATTVVAVAARALAALAGLATCGWAGCGDAEPAHADAIPIGLLLS